ncbi:MAG: hypothetical protein JWM91_896 [Rhodospirillales bacterium]|nr:hypothetical protein [Rhodospirillales bacterium]
MLKHSAFILGGLILAAGVALQPHEAQARVHVGVGIGFGAPFYGYGYAPYYYPPAVLYAPPPVVYAPPPPPVSYIAQPQQSLYYCDNPQGYYPSVQSCGTAWREVPASPAPDRR